MALARSSLQLSQRLRSLGAIRLISTTKKNNETASVEEITPSKSSTEEKNWISYGYSHRDKYEDESGMHSSLFGGLTICIVCGGYLFMHQPDIKLKDWAQREAFLEIRRREAAGLPHVDPNLIDPKCINLPSDEELGDTEIII